MKFFSFIGRGSVIAIIAGITIFFLFVVDPERTRVQSDDGFVTITGFARESEPFEIEREVRESSATFSRPSYTIRPSGIVLENPVVISFTILPNESDVNPHVYRFHEGLMMWEVVASEVSRTEHSLAVEVDRLGQFILGDVPSIDVPNFLTTYDELLSMAPPNTVGYEFALGFQDEHGSIAMIQDTKQVGGCAGLLTQGNREERSLIVQDAQVVQDDVISQIEFSFVARWFVSDLGGCRDGQTLEPFSVM